MTYQKSTVIVNAKDNKIFKAIMRKFRRADARLYVLGVFLFGDAFLFVAVVLDSRFNRLFG